MDVGFELVFDRRYVINSHQILQLVELIFREVKLILTGAVGIAVGMKECRQNSIAETDFRGSSRLQSHASSRGTWGVSETHDPWDGTC